jgi:hypothetical protein
MSLLVFMLPVLAETYGELQDDGVDFEAIYHLNGDATDATGNHNGTLGTSAYAPSVTNAVFGQGYTFDGGDYISASALFSIGTQTTWTFLWWAKTSSTGNQDYVFNHTTISGGTYIWCKRKDWGTTLECRDYVSWTASNLESTTAINDGNWHQYALVKESTSSHYLYIDGELVDTEMTDVGTTAVGGGTFIIGGDDDTPTVGWIGSLDELVVLTTGLTATEIRQLYHMQMGTYGIVE